MLTRYAQGSLVWIDLTAPTPAEVRELMREFSIDPLIVEELLVPSYKAKVEHKGEVLYIILHFPTPPGRHERPEQEIDFVIGKKFLITTHYGGIDPLHAFAKAFEVEAVLGRMAGHAHGGHLFAAMLRTLYQTLGDECDLLHRHLQEIEEHIFTGDERQMVIELSQESRTIYDFRQALVPHREMLMSLEPSTGRMFGAEFSFHLRSIEGSLQRVEHTLENLRDSLQELRETNNSLLSTKQNEVMKTLTVLAFVFLPLSFIAAVLGMSVPIPLAPVHNGFWLVLGFMALIAVGCFIFFKHKDWL